jgi:ABC-type Mn2+/Zn2+ transport system permease subunit
MNVLRSALAVVVGYFVFASGAVAFFRISGQPPHQTAAWPMMLGAIACGMLCALLGGYLAAVLAGRKPAAHGVAVACVLALGAAASLVATVGHGAIWSQLAALVLMAPCAWLGGRLRARRTAARGP